MVRRSHHALKLARQYRMDATLFAKGERLYAEKVRERQQQIADEEKENGLEEEWAVQLSGEAKESYARLQTLRRQHIAMQMSALNFELQDLARSSALRRYYQLLEAKYKLTAARPWLAVELDPPYP
ncbi:MAG: hypothetical protein NVSMB9_29240 [Isosphaeraceae bacterium]